MHPLAMDERRDDDDAWTNITAGVCCIFEQDEAEVSGEVNDNGSEEPESPNVSVWVRESSAEGYIEGVIHEWPVVRPCVVKQLVRGHTPRLPPWHR